MAFHKTKKTILCVHYNGNSSGSFVNAAVARFKELSSEFRLVCMLGSEGAFTEELRRQGYKVLVHNLHEMGDHRRSWPLLAAKFYYILKSNSVNAVYVMDLVHWRPIELQICKWLNIPTVIFCGFYKAPVFIGSALKDCNKIVTNSRATSNAIAAGHFKEKTKIIYNSINPGDFEQKRLRDCGSLTLGFIGSLIPIKGIEDLLRATPAIIQNSPVTKILIAGSDRDGTGYGHELRNLVLKLHLESHVDFVGHVDSRKFLSDIDILVVPSHDEPFGYVNIEAGAASLPVVATRVGGIPEIVEDGVTGILVPSKSPDALAVACIKLAQNRNLRQALGNNALARVKDNFSYQATMKQWTELFKTLV